MSTQNIIINVNCDAIGQFIKNENKIVGTYDNYSNT